MCRLTPFTDENGKWYDKGVARLGNRLTADFASDGVHKEHSPDYAIIMHNLFGSIQTLLETYNKSMPSNIEYLYKLQDYLAYTFMPNEKLTLIGDTGRSSIRSVSKSYITNPKLKFAVSREGERPETNSKVFTEGGIAFFRNGWDVAVPFHLGFTASTHSLVHKHVDDLSFTLNYKEVDFFVDSGKYSYDEENPNRKYIRSVFAHYSLVVDGRDIPLNRDLVGKSRIEKAILAKKQVM